MKKGGGGKKGSAFERVVCKKLSLWVSRGRRVDLFWRTAMSGGRSTVARKKGVVVRQAGDIGATTKDGHWLTDNWYIECKHYKRIDLGQFIVTNSGKLKVWWGKTVDGARKQGKDPMLIVKQNGWPILVITMRGALGEWVPPHTRLYDRHCDIVNFDAMIRAPWNRQDENPNNR